jgi:hypothetical protein
MSLVRESRYSQAVDVLATVVQAVEIIEQVSERAAGGTTSPLTVMTSRMWKSSF